ncbi:MAG: NlpC/P60 family protein [Candidatus Babeliales bacterium]
MNKLKIFVSLLFFTASTLLCETMYPQKMILSVPVADLRAQPQANSSDIKLPTSDVINPLQITQILLGEHILAHEEYVDENSKKWLKVNAPQQEFYKVPFGWHGFPGWIEHDQALAVDSYPVHNLVVKSLLANLLDEAKNILQTVSIGTRLNGEKLDKESNLWRVVLPDGQIAFIKNDDVYPINATVEESIDDLRKSIISKAMEFLGSSYSWGGRSAQNELLTISSVDCSSLMNLSFLAHGLQIPRMSHEQFLRSEKIEEGKDLKPGDLIFFTSITKKSSRMDHVMMYLGDNKILETTTLDQKKVRVIPFNERMCLTYDLLQSGDIIDCTEDRFRIFFSSFFKDEEMVQGLRNDALNHAYN